jgi:hypothetical protein
MKAGVRSLLVAAVVAGALFVGVTAAGAGEVRWFGACVDGTAETTSGPLTVSFGWATSSPGLTQKFLDVQHVTYSVNGGTSTTTTTGWGPITQGTAGNGKSIFASRWTSPVLATLASGQSATVTVSLQTSKKVWDDAKTSYPANTELLGSSTTCTITATS